MRGKTYNQPMAGRFAVRFARGRFRGPNPLGGEAIMAVLESIKGLTPGQLFPLEQDSAVLGRHPDCDIVLDIGAVSRQHARILKLDDGFFVEDLHSRNGTFLNEQSVRGRREAWITTGCGSATWSSFSTGDGRSGCRLAAQRAGRYRRDDG